MLSDNDTIMLSDNDTMVLAAYHEMWRGIMLYPLKILSVRPPVCLSVRRSSVSASFPDSNLSSFRPIFFKLCIDIGEEWFGIANGLNSFINNRIMALDWCKNFISGP